MFLCFGSHVNCSLFLRAASNAWHGNARDAWSRRVAVWFRNKSSWLLCSFYFFSNCVTHLFFFVVAVVHAWRWHARDAIFLHCQDRLNRDDFGNAIAFEALLLLLLFGFGFGFGFSKVKRVVTFQMVTFSAQLVACLLHEPLPIANYNCVWMIWFRLQRVLEGTNFFAEQKGRFQAGSVVKLLD